MSNESSEPVYFDDFKVADTRGRIIEENHYYAFGLRIDGISSKKLDVGIEGSLKNNNLYNDKELFDDADLDWYDYGFRNYDPQIGRFPQLDPLTDKFPELTPYQYASDEPIANVDMDGLEAIGSIVSSSLGEAVVTSSSFMPNIVVQGLKTAKSSASTLSVVGSFFKGAGKDLWGAVKGIGHAVVHLPTTLKNIADLNNPVNSAMAGLAIYRGAQNKIQEFKNGNANTKAEIIGAGAGEILQLFGGEIGEIGKVGEISKAAEISEEIGKVGEAAKVKYIGRLEDLKDIPRSQTLLDDLPNKWTHLSKQDAAKYLWRQNSSVLRKAIKDGYNIKDASWFRPNSELAPTLENPNRTIGQSFLGAERNLLNNRGL